MGRILSMLTLCTSSLCVCACAQEPADRAGSFAGPALESSLRSSLTRSLPPSFAHPARRGQISKSQEGSPEKDQVVGVRLPRLAHVGHSGLAARRLLRFLLQSAPKPSRTRRRDPNHRGRMRTRVRQALECSGGRAADNDLVRDLALPREEATHDHGRRETHAAQDECRRPDVRHSLPQWPQALSLK